MSKFLIGLVAVIVFGYLGGLIAWWGIVLVGVAVGFGLQMNAGLSFLNGLIGGGIFTAIHCMVIDSANQSLLSTKMEILLTFNPLIVAVVIGALLCAMGMVTGKYLRDATLGEVKKSRYRTRYR